MVTSEELIGTAEYQTQLMRCHTNRCRYSGVLYLNMFHSNKTIFVFISVIISYSELFLPTHCTCGRLLMHLIIINDTLRKTPVKEVEKICR